MTGVVRPQLAHPFAEDLSDLATQLLALGWILQAPAVEASPSPAPPPAPPPSSSPCRRGTLMIFAEPFGPPMAVVRLLEHHRLELQTAPGRKVDVEDVEDLHRRLQQQARQLAVAGRAAGVESRAS